MISIAIDGPSGSGKSTLAKALSAKTGYLYIDTGAMYRTVGLFAKRSGVDPHDAASLAAHFSKIDIELKWLDGAQHVFLNGEDVSEAIRTPEMSMYASAVSAIPAVRAFLLEMQRDMARRSSVIMDGRDIGTVVLPNAQVKIFLCADVQVRARRRTLELEQRGTPKPYEQVLEEMEQRDWADSHRSAAPLRPAEDAVVVDTTNMDFAQSKDAILQVIRRRTQP